ncbi:MAG: cupin domain-containing protein [Acidimicrobiia bacterium]|nr:cupin domain-containing protein [Acidimicrobiia bacterium]
MERYSVSDIEWVPAPAENFTGQVLFGPISSEGTVNMLGVHFLPGARTDWHTHPEGQILHVISGVGRVGTDDGTIEITSGDSVYSPPGQLHWHGAGPNGPMTHLSITTGGATEWAPRKVTDEEYGA